jgi:hypothetical protein
MLVLSLFRIFTSGPIPIATCHDTPCHPEAHILQSQSFQKKKVRNLVCLLNKKRKFITAVNGF